MDIYLLLVRQGLLNATTGSISAASIRSAATSGNAFIVNLNAKRYLVVLDQTLGSFKGPVACLLSQDEALQVSPTVRNAVNYPSLVSLEDTPNRTKASFLDIFAIS